MEALEKRSKNTEQYIKISAGILIWMAGMGFLFFALFQNGFGGTVWDKSIYLLGTLLGLGSITFWLYFVSFENILRICQRETFLQDAISVLCFACVCLMTLYYYNSASNYGHGVATRVMNSAFGIALIFLYREEERQKRWIFYLQTAAAAVFVAGTFLKERSGMELVPYVLSGITVWIYIRLLGMLAARILRGEICKRYSWYGYLVFLFFAGLLIFRNTRTWPFSVVIPFGSLYLYAFTKETLNRFLRNFCYGVITAFWLMAGSGIIFRPYYSFEFVRYPGWFSSVATAGLFWMLVIACTISCILAKVREKGTLPFKKIYLEWITLGAAFSYLFMTLSRTAALSVGAVLLTAFALSEAFYYRDSVSGMLKKAALVICPFLLLFPIIYTVTRCGPALVSRPVWITKAEWFSDRILKGEAPDSTKYMNIAQLGETFLEKWLGIDINLTEITGAVSGPGDRTVDENGEVVFDANVTKTEERDGQIYTVKDYTFYNPDTGDISNGRFEAFTLYAKELNLTGHDSMTLENTDVTLYHAHNTYMQVAYDHGIPMGILFLLIVAGGLVSAVLYYKKNCGQVYFAICPVVVVISFMIAGITEWIFHPSIPIGFSFLIVLTPLVQAKDSHAAERDGE